MKDIIEGILSVVTYLIAMSKHLGAGEDQIKQAISPEAIKASIAEHEQTVAKDLAEELEIFKKAAAKNGGN